MQKNLLNQKPNTVEESLAPEEPVILDTTKPVISPPSDLVIEATGSLTSVDIGDAIAMDESGIQLIVSNGPTLFPLGFIYNYLDSY